MQAELVDSGTASNGVHEDRNDLSDGSNSECIKNEDILLTDSVSDVDLKSASVVDGSTVTTCEESNSDSLSNDS